MLSVPSRDAVTTRSALGLNRINRASVLYRFADRSAGRRIPDPRSVIVLRSHHVPAIRAELGRINPIVMLHRFADRPAGRRIP